MKASNSSKFVSCVNSIYPSFKSIESQSCPDQFVALFNINQANTYFENNLDEFLFREDCNKLPADKKKFILLLESPHKDEFEGQPGPAKGITGKNIRLYLSIVIKQNRQLIHSDEYALVLMNAIQYQYSLGVSTNLYRDNIFVKCWDLFGAAAFKKRLEKLYKPGDFLINASTSGKPPGLIRERVNNAIVETIGSEPNLKTEHPSTWAGTVNYGIKHDSEPDFSWKSSSTEQNNS